MNTSVTPGESAVMERLDLISRVVGTAAATLAAGDFVDMTGLDGGVAELCAAAGALPPLHRERATRKLSRLVVDLSSLAQALSDHRAATERAAEAEARRRAAGAYPAGDAR